MRRVALALTCVSLCACAAQSTSESENGRTTATWRGTLESADTCIGGDLFVFVESEDGQAWSGSAYYESEQYMGEHFRSTYAVEGTFDSGKLVLRETDQLEADDGHGVLRWCMGSYRLDVTGTDTVENSSLSGEYEPFDCECAGAPTTLEPTNGAGMEREDLEPSG